MATKYRRLRGRIVEKFGNIGAFADRIGMTRVQTSNKLNGRSGLSADDIREWSEILDIKPREIGKYFFE